MLCVQCVCIHVIQFCIFIFMANRNKLKLYYIIFLGGGGQASAQEPPPPLPRRTATVSIFIKDFRFIAESHSCMYKIRLDVIIRTFFF